MKNLKIRQDFNAHLLDLLKAREERYKHLDKFPELKNVQIVREEFIEGKLIQERHIHLTDSLPGVIKTFLNSDSIILVEKSEFITEDNIHTFQVVPGKGLDQFFTIDGISKYHSSGDTTSSRDYDISIKSSAFLIGAVIESAIAEIYQHNLEKDKKSIDEFLIFIQGDKGDV